MIYHTALRVRAVNGHKVLGVLKFSLMVLGYYYIDTLRGFDSPIAHQTKSPSERSWGERFPILYCINLLYKPKGAVNPISVAMLSISKVAEMLF